MYSPTKKPVTPRIFAALIGLTVTVSLAACSNNDEDDNNPELGKTTDASVSESTEFVPASEDGPAQNVPEPRLPAVATENTEEGAEATLEYFWEAAQYSRLTGETSHIEKISADDCEFCNSFVEDWRSAYEAGKWAVPQGEVELDIAESWSTENAPDRAHEVDFLFTILEPSVDLYTSDGQLEQPSEGSGEESDWYAFMLYDATAQLWEIEWIGLEELVTWED